MAGRDITPIMRCQEAKGMDWMEQRMDGDVIWMEFVGKGNEQYRKSKKAITRKDVLLLYFICARPM